MLVDLHTHTSIGSKDSRISPEELVIKAKKRGLGAICITDHDSYKAVEKTRKIGVEKGLLVIGGTELTTNYGHIIVYGVNVNDFSKINTSDLAREIRRKESLSLEEIKDILYIFAIPLIFKIDGFIQRVHKQGGAVILPHPFGTHGKGETTVRYYLNELLGSKRNREITMEELLSCIKEQNPIYYSLLKQIDGVETSNPLCSWLENYYASMLAASLGKNHVGGSDCHSLERVGICVTEFPTQIVSEEDFILQLRQRKATAKINLTEDALSILDAR
jgi:predicted metal-dependent phosphoesterase TrpH